MNDTKNLIDVIRLIRTERIGTITFVKLIEQFGDASTALENINLILKRSNNSIKIYSKSAAEKEIEIAQKNNVEVIPYYSSMYPPLLRKTEDYPGVLFAKGHSVFLKKAAIAIVGSRNASTLGRQNAYNFAKDLGAHGFLVISGMAKGIDSAAHEGSIDKGTVAVLGSGIDIIYPKDNKKIYDQIVEKGLLISEFPLGTQPIPSNFPKRNRIISGISRGILVVEASANSGSIITAKLGLEQGRDVFAIPGNPQDPRSKGTNSLIKDGAVLVDNVLDIVNNVKIYNNLSENYVKSSFNKKLMQDELKEEKLQLVRSYLSENLSFSPLSVESISLTTGFTHAQILTIVLELELAGKIERHPDNKISLIGKN